MLATQITTHTQDAIARLMQQYKDSPRFIALITSLVDEIQDLENAIFSLDAGRQLYNSVGTQLDNLGTIVGIGRNGLPDAEYFLFILGQIGENNSDTTIAAVSNVYAALLNAAIVQEQELYPAGVGVSAPSLGLASNLIPIVYNMVQMSCGAGISLDFLEIFDPDNGFAFAGAFGTDTANGFGDLNDASIGGFFAYLLQNTIPFAFASTDPTDNALGFGNLLDPNIGGVFE